MAQGNSRERIERLKDLVQKHRLTGKDATMVGEVGGQIVYTPLPQTWERSKAIDHSLVELVKVLAG